MMDLQALSIASSCVLLGAFFGEDFFDEFEPWLKWKVYDVLFALGVVLLGRRLSRCPRAQRVLDFVSES